MHFRNSWTRSTSACAMRHVPSGASGGLGLNGLIDFFARELNETSVTRSLIGGNAFIGPIVTGLAGFARFSRFTHLDRRARFPSPVHTPHFPPSTFLRRPGLA